jgi:tRNA guanosine-2'-O-methyltransferase
MDLDSTVLYLDADSRARAFDLNWAKLDSPSKSLNLDALRLCVRLLPLLDQATSQATSRDAQPQHHKLKDLVLSRLPDEPQDAQHLYNLAEICMSNEFLACLLFDDITQVQLPAAISCLSSGPPSEEVGFNGSTLSGEEFVSKITTSISFLRCSFWLPRNQFHVLSPDTFELLTALVGLESINDIALDAVSALLSLLSHRQQESIVIASRAQDTDSWLKLDSVSKKHVLDHPIINQSLWIRLSKLGLDYFTSNSSKVFRVWFQWVTQAAVDGLDVQGMYEAQYWDMLRVGLLTGYADQRKYCLGIIRQSLLAAQKDIDTEVMQLRVDRRNNYVKAYERYSILFETVVLDRYANQVEACLNELSTLFSSQSEVTATMATTLLSSALDPQVQDGLRKIVGNWYFNFVTRTQTPLVNGATTLDKHTSFLVEGFLPWATQGSLFTSTLKATRDETKCLHGKALADLIASFVACKAASEEYRRSLLVRVLKFVLDAGGRIFQFSILYLLEGLVMGFEEVERQGGSTCLEQAEIDYVFRISRTTGLPEIASDLYKVYCKRLCDFVAPQSKDVLNVSSYKTLVDRLEELSISNAGSDRKASTRLGENDSFSLHGFLTELKNTKHVSIQGDAYGPACDNLVKTLNEADPASVKSGELYAVLEALWEEADRREFNRSVAVHLPSLLFHPTCVYACLEQEKDASESAQSDSLKDFLTKAMLDLQRFSEGRSYILAGLATSLRKAALSYPAIMEVLPFEDFILRFLNFPPAAKTEFLFEVAAAEKLQKFMPYRGYSTYYGQREWYAYAAWIDLLARFPEEQVHVAKRIFDQLIEPWAAQKSPIPVISKWKDVLQLQAMLVLTQYCVSESDADTYLKHFMHALNLEQWPRYRYLLEWIIARIYFRFPSKTANVLQSLANLDEGSPIHIASLMKLAVLVAPFLESEDFSLDLMTQLIPFSASQKVHIRHEAHWSFPIVFDLATRRGWNSIAANPALIALNKHIRHTEKFKTPAWSIRTLRLDAVDHYTLSNIFQGQYLYIETPEAERVTHSDFVELRAQENNLSNIPSERVSLGSVTTQSTLDSEEFNTSSIPADDGVAKSNFFQTKSGFDYAALLPSAGPPSAQNQRPSSVILVASLIDNPTNLGGLSRISESFGLEALYINDVKKVAHKDFKATSVTSEKHLPIRELRIHGVPSFLIDAKTKGYEVVGIEQTDRSGILGEEGEADKMDTKGLGLLPKKCVLVLGSEKGGISPEVLSVIDRCVEIRTVGVTRSLNVQTAGGIAVYEWWREWAGKM